MLLRFFQARQVAGTRKSFHLVNSLVSAYKMPIACTCWRGVFVVEGEHRLLCWRQIQAFGWNHENEG